jgi:Subtilase family
MKYRTCLLGILAALLWAAPARADNRFIVRSTLPLSQLQVLCVPLSAVCTSVSALNDPLGQLVLITSPLDLSGLLNLGGTLLGIVDAEVDQLLNLIGPTTTVGTTPSSLLDMVPVNYCGGTVWNGYAAQPAAGVVNVAQAQNNCTVIGSGIVADIDTGVDPNHPALKPVLVAGYDFTRNQQDASELNDLNPTDFKNGFPNCPTNCTSAFTVNQSSAAILDQSSAAILDTPANGYAAFGHGTMVMGVIHLVAPAAKLMPLKAFKADGTGNLSDILRAIYFAVANSANVINMSFETQTSSLELAKALDYANQKGLIAAASAGNDGQGPSFLVYPAALQTDVMGVASVGSTPATDATRSSFSNYGDDIVWVAAPGEAIVTTYPFSTYAAGWGTSFSAPFVSGGSSLLLSQQASTNQGQAAAAIAKGAVPIGSGMGHGRLDLAQALLSLSTADYSMSATSGSSTVNAGDTATYTLTVTPVGGFNQTVTLSCSGFPSASTCDITPSVVPLDGTNPATAMVTVKTTIRGSSPPLAWPRIVARGRQWEMLAALFGWIILAVLLFYLNRGEGNARPGRLVHAAAFLAILLHGYSCGGGGYGGGGGSSPTLYSVAVNPTSVQGGNPSTGTVTLSGAAPSGGAVVGLSSSNAAAATVPASVTVPAGGTTATFTATTSAVSASTPVTVSASYGGATKTATLTVTPAPATGTPAGTYTITITGTTAANLNHATTVDLKVN